MDHRLLLIVFTFFSLSEIIAQHSTLAKELKIELKYGHCGTADYLNDLEDPTTQILYKLRGDWGK